MNTDSRNPEIKSNEGHEALYGRRVEVDRTWTVYHVFTGVPADTGGGVMMGLSRADATDKMVWLNRHPRRWSRNPVSTLVSTDNLDGHTT